MNDKQIKELAVDIKETAGLIIVGVTSLIYAVLSAISTSKKFDKVGR